jgi:hypothetical protein
VNIADTIKLVLLAVAIAAATRLGANMARFRHGCGRWARR